MHSYGNLYAGPWAYTDDSLEQTDGIADAALAAEGLGQVMAAAATNEEGEEYVYCRGSCNGLGLASGTMQDFYTVSGEGV